MRSINILHPSLFRGLNARYMNISRPLGKTLNSRQFLPVNSFPFNVSEATVERFFETYTVKI